MSLALSSLLVLLSSTGAASPNTGAKSEFFDLFATTCLANAYTPDKLRQALSTPLTPEISKEQAVPFLGGQSGTVWRFVYGKGEYAVALIDSNVCAVFARRAPINAVTADFSRFAANPPASLLAKQLAPQEAGPNTEDLTSIAFTWQVPGKQPSVLYILTTSKAAIDPEIQAMASITVNAPEP